eukprot:gnl/MRDRNA2_/MRDRNA2_160136_c0_seq1.p1 gnl/MRDRNA2_/MRDRNA2_160136_c0~~gnl/MRDRNA2_/MRDRNA2_160136_c0_seq1.p1  ORF type:complete len:480 (+),score=70.32 gnl/MRDRNA2_/MRDRNA2_160136_c0_seq1:44-1483(+)
MRCSAFINCVFLSSPALVTGISNFLSFEQRVLAEAERTAAHSVAQDFISNCEHPQCSILARRNAIEQVFEGKGTHGISGTLVLQLRHARQMLDVDLEKALLLCRNALLVAIFSASERGSHHSGNEWLSESAAAFAQHLEEMNHKERAHVVFRLAAIYSTISGTTSQTASAGISRISSQLGTVDQVSIGFFLLAFREAKENIATVLRGVRRHFPRSPFWLLSDAGLDYSSVCAGAGELCRFVMAEQNIGVNKERNKAFTCEAYMNRIEEATRWAIGVAQVRWMIFLEPDSRMISPIRIAPSAACCGLGNMMLNNDWDVEFIRWVEQKHGRTVAQISYATSGGSIFGTEEFLKARRLAGPKIIAAEQKLLTPEDAVFDPRILNYADACLPGTFMLAGYTVGGWLDSLQYETSADVLEPDATWPTGGNYNDCRQCIAQCQGSAGCSDSDLDDTKLRIVENCVVSCQSCPAIFHNIKDNWCHL